MTAEEALNLVDSLLCSTFGQRLNDVQSVVFLESWLGRTYAEIAVQISYEHDYIKQIGCQLWRSLSQLFGQEVCKKNIQTVLRCYHQSSNSSHSKKATDINIFELDKIGFLNSELRNQRGTIISQAIDGVPWTVQDLDVLPENEWTRYEIINGELFVTPAPHRRHQQVCGKISRLLDIWSEFSDLGETIIAPGVLFSQADSIIPDVVWVSRERLAQIEDEAGHLIGAPELVVEVLSPGKQNELRDKEAKLKLYSIHAVGEYWIVDRFTQKVEVYRREKAQLVLVATLLNDDEITSPLLPGFSCSIRLFFPA